MKIETEFDPGCEVWMIIDNIIQRITITTIVIIVSGNDKPIIEYNGGKVSLKRDKMFLSKKELVEDLTKYDSILGLL